MDELVTYIKIAIERYGLIVIGPLSFLENMVGLNVYFPGSIVILTAMALTAGNPVRGLITYLTIYGAAFVAYHINYFIGFSTSRKVVKNKNMVVDSSTNKTLWLRFFSTFWHPHFAALTCIHVGNEGYKYKQIMKYLIVVSFVWNTFWGLTMYSVGTITPTTGNSLTYIVYLYIIGWLLLSTYRYYKNKGELFQRSNPLLKN